MLIRILTLKVPPPLVKAPTKGTSNLIQALLHQQKAPVTIYTGDPQQCFTEELSDNGDESLPYVVYPKNPRL